jgi:hypothetical protein
MSDGSNHRATMNDAEWWQTFVRHFSSRIPGLTDMMLLQINVKRLLLKDNVEWVSRAVWLAVEITRCREGILG